jgi:hypothetical protein
MRGVVAAKIWQTKQHHTKNSHRFSFPAAAPEENVKLMVT